MSSEMASEERITLLCPRGLRRESALTTKETLTSEDLEARGGIEPPIMVLQTIALPLGDRATGLKSCQFSVLSTQLSVKKNVPSFSSAPANSWR